MVCIHTEDQNQMSFCPFTLRKVSVLTELIIGHLRYSLTDEPPQSNSPSDTVFSVSHNHHLDGHFSRKQSKLIVSHTTE